MILEFKEIINPKFKEEIANLKNNIKNTFLRPPHPHARIKDIQNPA